MNISDYKKLEIIYFLTQLKMMKLGYTSEKDPVLLINFICCSNGYYSPLFDGLDDIDLANVELVLARTFDDVIEEIAGFNENNYYKDLQPSVNFTLLGANRSHMIKVPFNTLYSIYYYHAKNGPIPSRHIEPFFQVEAMDY